MLNEQEQNAFDIIVITTGVFALFVTFVSALVTYQQRRRRIFVFAQIEFVFLLLLGLVMVSAAAILAAIPASDEICVSIAWLLSVGYTLELVPLVIKIAAIHRLLQASRRMKRIKLSRQLLFGYVAAIVSLVVIFMITWTVLDSPTKNGHFELTSETSQNKHVVQLTYFCKSESGWWSFTALGMQSFLLLCSSMLAFMTRKSRGDINETSTIAFLIYWNFLCVLLRIILVWLGEEVDVATANRVRSLVLSIDSIATTLIYFLPKFLKKEDGRSGRGFVNVNLTQSWRLDIDNDNSQAFRLPSSATPVRDQLSFNSRLDQSSARQESVLVGSENKSSTEHGSTDDKDSQQETAAGRRTVRIAEHAGSNNGNLNSSDRD